MIAVTLVRKLLGFALVSGTGLLIDFGLFMLLLYAGLDAAIANFLSASAAVTFVYFISVYHVFSNGGRFLLPLFALYAAYQALAVSAASLLVGYLAAHWMPAPLAKLAVLPLTFTTNFLVMALITRKRSEPAVFGGVRR